MASAYGIWSMPPTGWNISIAWSQPNSKEKFWPMPLSSTSWSANGGPSTVPASVPAPGSTEYPRRDPPV